MYNSVSYLVKVKGGLLPDIKSTLGLKQGGVLSPLLFNIFVDDIRFIFDDTCSPITLFNESCSHLLYADDLILMSHTKEGLTNCLSKLNNYCNVWKMEVNISKIQVIIFNNSGRKLIGPEFLFNGHYLKSVQSYCYLGIQVTSSGSFRVAKTALMEKARKAIFSVYPMITQFNLPIENSVNLFKTLIKPIILYNSENLSVLSNHQIKSIETNKCSLYEYIFNADEVRVQLRYLKFILGVSRSTSNAAIFGDLGEFPIQLDGFKSLLTFWHRTRNLPKKTPVYQALELQYRDIVNSNWVQTVKLLLEKLELGQYLEDPSQIEERKFSNLCKERLKQFFIKNWTDKLDSDLASQTSKLHFYSKIKRDFKKEPYLDLPVFEHRKAICKIRCSDHKLAIETGRHRNILYNQRYCKFCKDSQLIETEEHFLLFCSHYNDLRERYLKYIHTNLDIGVIFECHNNQHTFLLSNYIIRATKFRNEQLVRETVL